MLNLSSIIINQNFKTYHLGGTYHFDSSSGKICFSRRDIHIQNDIHRYNTRVSTRIYKM